MFVSVLERAQMSKSPTFTSPEVILVWEDIYKMASNPQECKMADATWHSSPLALLFPKIPFPTQPILSFLQTPPSLVHHHLL